ncbi:MBL fold metallo-hydrolase [Halorientalis marina]|jgi:glyoxylase-like metal-dependent hydrolase (beta-lactamase superfamily II)|uniref:MBL fold metallo-hydrolase n=1 Tax=Halorientalis marina TaxID=2931976 RepID=UPI001FF45D1A|nr:MBL fold metallo-hydrolase [Halorientalis marina]
MTTFQVTDGVHGIDAELFDSGFLSAYLFDDDEPTLVDPGHAAGAGTVLDGVRECGVDPADLQHVVCSHVHVDHAGAASAVLDAAPDADVHIHEMTAPHLADPADLIASSREAMGEQFAAMGEQDPVPEDRIVEVPGDGTTLDIGANTLELIHAPGHSPDHFAIWNAERDLLFAAECLGGYLERADNFFPPSTLPNFDVGLIEDAIARLREFDPEHVLFPHFGAWPGDPGAVFENAERELHRYDERIRELHDETGSVAETKARVREELMAVSPPYDPVVEEFYTSLVTDGYLKYHGRL